MAKAKRKYYDINVSDIPLIEYTNIFVGNMTWINRGVHNSIATYDLVVREKPADWGFYIFDGLERYVDYLLQFKFDADAIKILKAMGLINSPDTLKFYKNFKFTGDVWALPEGTIFFPGEPILRITAPLAEANIITAFTLNSFSYPIRTLTKVARVKLSAQDKTFSAFGAVRLVGFEQAIWSVRANEIMGGKVRSITPQLYRKFSGIKPSSEIFANINHAFIKSFPTEAEAYRYVFDVLQPISESFLVMTDTYGFEHGLKLFVTEALKTKHFNQKKFRISIDSGDLLSLSKYAREYLDQHGFTQIEIQVFSNLDEYKIKALIDQKAEIDYFIASTEVTSISDNPKFEAVYKMAELCHANGCVEQKAKLAEGKLSLPGRKQVFRVFDISNKMQEDIIGLEEEKLGEPLLKQFVKKGKQIGKFENLDGVRARVTKQLASLPEKYKAIRNPAQYPVRISNQIQNLLTELKQKHG